MKVRWIATLRRKCNGISPDVVSLLFVVGALLLVAAGGKVIIFILSIIRGGPPLE